VKTIEVRRADLEEVRRYVHKEVDILWNVKRVKAAKTSGSRCV
jgi:hypothetical protein